MKLSADSASDLNHNGDFGFVSGSGTGRIFKSVEVISQTSGEKPHARRSGITVFSHRMLASAVAFGRKTCKIIAFGTSATAS